MERITIGCKVGIDEANQIKEEAQRQGISLNEYVKKKLESKQTDYEEGFKELYNAINFSSWQADTEKICRSLIKKMESGEILIEGNEVVLKAKGALNTKKFEDACFEKGLNAQKEIDKATQEVWNRRTGGAGGS